MFLCAAAVGPAAADDEWIEVTTPRMVVLSQASEQRTLEWVREFNQFVDALHRFVPLNERFLPPLTVVLFARGRDFQPYRVRTGSGTVSTNIGVFVNFDTWSVVSLSATNRLADTGTTTYHEAVHWFMAADPAVRPTWFNEGIAEVFSTYKIVRDRVRWGESIPEHVGFLRTRGLQPMDDFLRLSQDEALHGTSTYYAQSWAFLHYMLFGQTGGSRAQLGQFLTSLNETGPRTAFETSFGKTYDQMDADLASYLRRGSYGMAEILIKDIPATAADFTVAPAAPARVELGLARLALGTGNLELAVQHARTLGDLAPSRADTYDTMAAVAQAIDDEAMLDTALERAIEMQSTDALTYELKARRLSALNLRDSRPPNEIFPPNAAREIADAIVRSIQLRPNELQSYERFVAALISATQFTDEDTRVLDLGQRLYPDSAVFDVGRAAVAHGRGDDSLALRHLNDALDETRRKSSDNARVARYLQERWTVEYLNTRLEVLTEQRRFDEAYLAIDEVLQNERTATALRRTLGDMREYVASLEALYTATEAIRDGRIADGRAMLEALAADPATDRTLRRDIERTLERLPER
jgi:hypothetical protein